jgi:hypothetical protein
MKPTKKDLIRRILELDTCVTKEELLEEDIEDLLEKLEDLSDDSDMFPNGRDFDAEDDDFV